MLFHSFILSVFTYAIEVWACAYGSRYFSKIDKFCQPAQKYGYTKDRIFINNVILTRDKQLWEKITYRYRNFRPFTRRADYPQRSIFVVIGKKIQLITCTGRLPAPQNKRKSCYCITHIKTHKLRKLGAMNIPCCCLQSRRSIAFSAANWLLVMQPQTLNHFLFVLLKRPKYPMY